MAPKMTISVPLKLEVTATLRAETSASTDSRAPGCCSRLMLGSPLRGRLLGDRRWGLAPLLLGGGLADAKRDQTRADAAPVQPAAGILRARSCIRRSPPDERIEFGGRRDQLPGEAGADRQDEGRQQEAQLLAFQPLAGHRAELRADHAARHQDHRQHHIDIVVLRGMQHRGGRGQEHDLEQRCADHDVGRHAQQIDHGRDHDEAAAHAHDGRQQADEQAEQKRRNGADVELGAVEAHLERQAVHPVVLARAPARHDPAGARLADGVGAFDHHQRADHAEERHVAGGDEDIEHAEAPEHADQLHADRGADEAAGQQHAAHLDVDVAPAPLRQRARYRGGQDLRRLGADGDRGRDAGEDQQRRHQEAAADAEHAREEADRPAHGEENENIRRHLGDGQIKLHATHVHKAVASGGPAAARSDRKAQFQAGAIGWSSDTVRPMKDPRKRHRRRTRAGPRD